MSVILDIPLVSIRTEIVKQDKVKTFYIAVKCFLIDPKNGQGELTTPESRPNFWINILRSSGPHLSLFFLVSVISVIKLISINF